MYSTANFLNYLIHEMNETNTNPFNIKQWTERISKYIIFFNLDSLKINGVSIGIIISLFTPFIIFMIMRRIYCKNFFKAHFKQEYTTLLKFYKFNIEELISNKSELKTIFNIDKGTWYYILTTFGTSLSILSGLVSYLVLSEYTIISLCFFAISLVTILLVIKKNIQNIGKIKGIIFSIIQFLFSFAMGVIYIFLIIFSLVLLKYILMCFSAAIFMIFGITISLPTVFKDEDGYVPRVTRRFHEYTGQTINKYDYVDEDIFGHIILRDENGEEIEIYQDKSGNYRRIDNDKLID